MYSSAPVSLPIPDQVTGWSLRGVVKVARKRVFCILNATHTHTGSVIDPEIHAN